MTKTEFFAMRDKQRANGEIIPAAAQEIVNSLTASEEAAAVEALGNQKGGIFRTSQVGLTGLIVSETYTGKTVMARRNKVDELDNVTIWRI